MSVSINFPTWVQTPPRQRARSRLDPLCSALQLARIQCPEESLDSEQQWRGVLKKPAFDAREQLFPDRTPDPTLYAV
jgi:hypothetical protein